MSTSNGTGEGRAEQVLAFVREYIDARGVAPLTREICDGVGINTPGNARYYLAKLEAAGLIKRLPGVARGIYVDGRGGPGRTATDDVLDFVRDYTGEHGYPPGRRDIMDGCDSVSSTSVAEHHLRKLEDAGHLRRIPGIARGIVLTEDAVA